MAELRTIARPYAEAAFALAKEEGAFAHWSTSLEGLSRVVQMHEVAELIGNPQLPVDLIAAAQPGLSKNERSLLSLIATNERLSALSEISAMYESLRNQAEQVLAAAVTSAFPMTEGQITELTGLLEKKHGKQVKVTVVVDPTLIGGVSIAIGDEVFDASVRGKLSRMATALMN
ncbi:MAG: F0F1 ATP synthase subunit delta [Burkholderiaceae bacterium]